MAAEKTSRTRATASMAAAVLVVSGLAAGAGVAVTAGPAAADSGTLTYACDIPGLGTVDYLAQAQGTIPPDLQAGTSFSLSGLGFTSTSTEASAVDEGDTISGSVTTTLDAIGATPASQTVTLDITPYVAPDPPAIPTIIFTSASTPTFTATGGPVAISTGPSISAFAVSVNGAPQPSFGCTGPSPGGTIAYSSPGGTLVANDADNTVSVVDPTTGTVDGTIPVGDDPSAVAITPDGQTAYVADSGSNAVSVIDTASGNTVGAPVAAGDDPVAVGITPDGQTAYVVDAGGGTVTPLSVVTGKAAAPIHLSGPGPGPTDIAIAPDGTTAYVTDGANDEIHVLDLTTATDTGTVPLDAAPGAVVVSPDGSTVYAVADSAIAVIATATDTVSGYISLGSPGTLGVTSLAITPDGSTLYAAVNSDSGGSVVPIPTGTDAPGDWITLPGIATAVAFSPDGTTAYVTVAVTTDALVPVTVSTGAVGSTTGVGNDPDAVAVQPDEAPGAVLSVTANYPGSPTTFDASQSTYSTSPIASYTWNFGDGSPPQTTSTPTTTYSYASPGTYTATVTETDEAGTSTTETFTGQTVSNSGSTAATASQQVVIVPCTADEPCAATVTSPTVTSDLSGTSSTDALLAVSIGPSAVSCGSAPAQTAEVTTYATTTFTASSIQATLTVAGVASASGFSVCYDSTVPFTDAQDQSVTSGQLPGCQESSPVAPCLVSATEESGSVVAVLDVLPGDPRFWPATTPVTAHPISPATGVAGGKVSIKGAGLSAVTAVLFGNTSATYSILSGGKKISAVVPATATSGPVTLRESSGTTISAGTFTLAAPSIKAVKGEPGHTVTIKGKDLSAVSQVTFGGLVALVVTKDTTKSVSVTVPSQATSGTVTVVTPGGTAKATFTAT
jgi:YVTN family beta-propeller protein